MSERVNLHAQEEVRNHEKHGENEKEKKANKLEGTERTLNGLEKGVCSEKSVRKNYSGCVSCSFFRAFSS